MLQKFWQNFDKKNEITELCKGVHCVDLGESFQTHIELQNLALIQPRTSPVKFARSVIDGAANSRSKLPGGLARLVPATARPLCTYHMITLRSSLQIAVVFCTRKLVCLCRTTLFRGFANSLCLFWLFELLQVVCECPPSRYIVGHVYDSKRISRDERLVSKRAGSIV